MKIKEGMVFYCDEHNHIVLVEVRIIEGTGMFVRSEHNGEEYTVYYPRAEFSKMTYLGNL